MAKYLVQHGFSVTSEPRLQTAGRVKVLDVGTGAINTSYTNKLVNCNTVEVKDGIRRAIKDWWQARLKCYQ